MNSTVRRFLSFAVPGMFLGIIFAPFFLVLVYLLVAMPPAYVAALAAGCAIAAALIAG